MDEALAGGVANAGAVYRRGVAVRRPAPSHAAAVHSVLRALREAGFHGSPLPRRLSAEGWEELEFLHGEVPLPPFPAWSLTDEALVGVGVLLRRYHDAVALVPLDRTVGWPADLADPAGGPILCHNDVCPENVVFRDGRAAALIDFDFAAPGRPVWDLAMTARYWVPILDRQSAATSGRALLDPAPRLRLLVDAYDPEAADRAAVVDVVGETIEVARRFVAARVGAGVPAFVAAFEHHGGWPRWDRIARWFDANRAALEAAVRG